MILEKIIKKLKAEGVRFRIHEHEPVLTMQDVLDKLPFSKDRLLKTLVFKVKGSGWIFAVVRAKDMVDYRALSQILGVPRSDIKFPTTDDIKTQLGLQVGGICPVPVRDDILVVFDKHILGMDTVYCGAGQNDCTLEIKADDIVRVCNARIGCISKHT